MSAKHLAVAADIIGLPPTCKLLLYALAIAADIHDQAVVTNAELRNLTGLSERAVRSNCRHLEELGLIRPLEQSFGYRFTLGEKA